LHTIMLSNLLALPIDPEFLYCYYLKEKTTA